jgi:hypothetical protein
MPVYFSGQNSLFGSGSPLQAPQLKTPLPSRNLFPMLPAQPEMPPVQAPQTFGATSFEQPAMRSYLEHLEARPDYSEYKPRWWNRLGGALTGAGTGLTQGGAAGAQAGQYVRDAPYYDQYRRWADEATPLHQAATTESEALKNQIDAYLQERELGVKEFTAESGRMTAEASGENAVTNRLNALTNQREFETTNIQYWVDSKGMLHARNEASRMDDILGESLEGEKLDAYKARTGAYGRSYNDPASAYVIFRSKDDNRLYRIDKRSNSVELLGGAEGAGNFERVGAGSDLFYREQFDLQQILRQNANWSEFVEQMPGGGLRIKDRSEVSGSRFNPFNTGGDLRLRSYDAFIAALERGKAQSIVNPDWMNVNPPDVTPQLPPGWEMEPNF